MGKLGQFILIAFSTAIASQWLLLFIVPSDPISLVISMAIQLPVVGVFSYILAYRFEYEMVNLDS